MKVRTIQFLLMTLVSTLFLFAETAVAAEDKEIPAWLRLKEVTFQVVEPTQIYTVKVEIPDLTELKVSTSPLEYGTDYFFTLKASEPVKISYYKDGEDKANLSVEMDKTLGAHSVIVARDREQTPHYLEIVDPKVGAEYEIYLSKTKGAAYVKFKGSDKRLKVISSK